MREHKIDKIEVSKCVLLERNPQYLTPKQMDSLKKSIERDGFVVPILVKKIDDDHYRIVSGNHRFMAAQELGYEHVPAVIADLTEDECKRLAINLNLIHGDPLAEQLAPFLADFSDDLLKDIHIEDDLLKDIKAFDVELRDRLNSLDVPDSINRDSPQGETAICTCQKCGRKHIRLSSGE